MIRGDLSWSLIAWSISFSILTTIAVILRFWSSKIQKNRIFLDDIFVIVSYVSMIAQQAVAGWAINNGLGNPITDLSISESIVQAKVVIAISMTWIVSTTTVKLAVLALYMRIFTTRLFKRWAICFMAIVASFGISFFVAFLTHCNPVSQEWAPVPGGSCRSLTSTELASSSLNLVIDTAILVLPMPWLYNLQMPLQRKLFVMLMFSFGFATIAIMCFRIEYTVHTNPDPLLASAEIGLLSDLELWLGIIVACLPTMAPFVRAHVKPGLSKLSHKIYGSSGISTKEGTPQVQLRTFGGSGAPGSKNHSKYSELDEELSTQSNGDELHLVPNGPHKVHTDIEFGNTQSAPNSKGIYVQKQFETYDV